VKTKESDSDDSKDGLELNEYGQKVNINRTPQELYDMELEDAIEHRKYVIRQNSVYRIYWDFLIILFAILNSIILPFDIAFPKDIAKFPIFSILDSLMTYIFVMDVILGFITSYINVQTGDEVYGYKFISKEYVFRGTFVIDILSTF
jgi:hypothetical protein